MKALYKTEPHYIRCIKSNHQKKPNIFEAPMILRQLTFSGTFEAVEIRQSGFPFRKTFEIFFRRYRMLLSHKNNHGNDFSGDYLAGTKAIVDDQKEVEQQQENIVGAQLCCSSPNCTNLCPHSEDSLFDFVQPEKGSICSKICIATENIEVTMTSCPAQINDKGNAGLKKNMNCICSNCMFATKSPLPGGVDRPCSRDRRRHGGGRAHGCHGWVRTEPGFPRTNQHTVSTDLSPPRPGH